MTHNAPCCSHLSDFTENFSKIRSKSCIDNRRCIMIVFFSIFMQSVRSSKTKIKATEFPSFLYPADAVYDCDKPLIGLLRGELLVRVSVLVC